jgi:hypothetical protein
MDATGNKRLAQAHNKANGGRSGGHVSARWAAVAAAAAVPSGQCQYLCRQVNVNICVHSKLAGSQFERHHGLCCMVARHSWTSRPLLQRSPGCPPTSYPCLATPCRNNITIVGFICGWIVKYKH